MADGIIANQLIYHVCKTLTFRICVQTLTVKGSMPAQAHYLQSSDGSLGRFIRPLFYKYSVE